MRSLKLILDSGLVLYGAAAVGAHWLVGDGDGLRWVDKPVVSAADVTKPLPPVGLVGQQALMPEGARGGKHTSTSSQEPALR